MSDIAGLKLQREKPLFREWAGDVSDERIESVARTLRGLVDDLVELGPDPTEDAAREAVDNCVRQLNTLDDGWITTIEREDLSEAIYQVIDLAGFEADEDWTNEREW